ncbi:MAG TPA: DUF3131 domain-containing protein, partial [Gemmatimonadaceae bacterium]
MRIDPIVRALTLVLILGSAAKLDAQRTRKTSSRPKTTTRTPARPTPTPETAPAQPIAAAPGSMVDERQIYMDASRVAWAFVNRNYQPSTGLARAHDTYQYVTMWDVASGLGATYAAHELGLVSDAVYTQRIQRALATLSTMDLFDGAAFNKSYDSKTGKMIDR